ncbi:hypothetical protein ACVCNR_22055 (plasmid) [Aquamicrobium terrae]
MKSGRFISAVFALIMMTAPGAAQVVDYLGVPGPIEFDGKSYGLAWSSQPSANYTKQEYVSSGQAVETYDQMLLLERVTGGVKVIDAVRGQIDALQKRKGSDPLVNFEVLQKNATGEVLLDFLISSKDSKGEYIVEWNLYRYAPVKEPSGKSGVLLFAVSHRAYGNENSKAFLGGLKQLRTAQTGALLKADLPEPGK